MQNHVYFCSNSTCQNFNNNKTCELCLFINATSWSFITTYAIFVQIYAYISFQNLIKLNIKSKRNWSFFLKMAIGWESLDLKKQFTFYASYHNQRVNVAIHLLCIWPILATALLLLQVMWLVLKRIFLSNFNL